MRDYLFLICMTGLLFSCLATSVAEDMTSDPATEWRVQPGDMMWKIAEAVRRDEAVSRFQAMMALLRANPQAFQHSCNMNSLKVGALLKIPSQAVMQAFNAREAAQAYSQQLQVWEDYRRKRIKIECPDPPLPLPIPATVNQTTRAATNNAIAPIANATVHTEQAVQASSTSATTSAYLDNPPLSESSTLSVESTQVARLPTSETATVLLPRSSSQVSVDNLSESALENTANTAIASPAPLSDSATRQLLWPLLIAGSIGLSVMLLGGMFMGWLLHRWLTAKSPPAQLADPAAAPQHALESAVTEQQIEEKLRHVRAYLAGGESVVQVLLRDIIEHGSAQQQEEARQLYEIDKKLMGLGDYTANLALTESPAWAKLKATSEQVSLKNYVPEDETRLFTLIDKMFELLDDELQADGKLLQTYRQRQAEAVLETEEYEVVSKPQEEATKQGRRTRSVRKPPRRL